MRNVAGPRYVAVTEGAIYQDQGALAYDVLDGYIANIVVKTQICVFTEDIVEALFLSDFPLVRDATVGSCYDTSSVNTTESTGSKSVYLVQYTAVNRRGLASNPGYRAVAILSGRFRTSY